MQHAKITLVFVTALAAIASCSSNPGTATDGGADAAVVPCTSDKACQATQQVCDPLRKRCVDCLFDAHCDNGEHCRASSCTAYITCTNSLDCKSAAGKPICSKLLGECVACDEAADCGADQECEENVCVAYTPCKNSKDCTDQVCDMVRGRCVDCLSKEDCDAEHDCQNNKCKLSIPCQSDKQCIDKDMLCDKAVGVCKVCLAHADCPAVYHCKDGECVVDKCITGQSKCADKTMISYCNDAGDGYDSPKSCGPLMCAVSGNSAKCTKWFCNPPCSGTTDTCAQGACKCGSGPPCTLDADTCVSGTCKCGAKDACSGAADRCVSGVCKCGSAPPCSGATNHCSSGVCRCGTGLACSGDTDTCLSGTCMCGSAPACSGSTDTCSSGICRCGSGMACSGAAETCVKGACQCGVMPPCSGNSDTCVAAVCMCGSGPACAFPETCVGSVCVACVKDADCDDKLTCTSDTCVVGVCKSALDSGNCLIGGVCRANGAINPVLSCETCAAATSTSLWSVVTGTCRIDGVCYAKGAKHAGGCKVCEPTKSQTSWSPLLGCAATHAWSKTFGTSAGERGIGLATDSNGNIYLVGTASGAGFDLGGGLLPGKGGQDILLASYTASGAHRWSKRLGGPGIDQATSVATDSSGNVYVTGDYGASVDLGGGTLPNAGSTDLFVASFTSSGAHRWSKGFGSSQAEHGYGITVDGSGHVYVTGSFNYSINPGGGALTSKGNSDLVIASFTSAGAHRWSKGFGGTDTDRGYSVAVDKSGNVYVGGSFSKTINLGTGIVCKGYTDALLASFTSAGVQRWSKGFGDGSWDNVRGVVVDSLGNVTITGAFRGSVSFGGSVLNSNGGYDVFLASYTSAGGHRWSKGFGNTDNDNGYAIAIDSADHVFITGSYWKSVDFGGGALAGTLSDDIFVAGFTSAGAHRWSYGYGAGDNDYGRGVAAYGQSALYVTGSVKGVVNLGGGVLAHMGAEDAFLLKLGL